MSLVNQTSIGGMCETHHISPSSLYLKIDFFYKRCLEFMGVRERRLINGLPLKRIELAIDLQKYIVNWSSREDRRNMMMEAVCAADNISGYAFPIVLNFEPHHQLHIIEKYAYQCGDYNVPYPFRKYARLWLWKNFIRLGVP